MRRRVVLFDNTYLSYFMTNYVEWDNPYEYYILLDQRWLSQKVVYRPEFVQDLIQKIKFDNEHKMRKQPNLLRLFCKFYDKYAQDKENDLVLKKVFLVNAHELDQEKQDAFKVTCLYVVGTISLNP